MKTVQRIAKNTVVPLLSDIVSKVPGFFYVMYTARYLGVERFGILSFALAFTGIFGVFGDLGLQQLTVREVARDKSLARKYLGNIAVMKIFLVVITFGLIALTINLLGYPEQTIKVVYFVALSVIFGAFTEMFYSIFRAFERMEYQSIGQILHSVLMLLGALFAISHGFDVVGFASIYFLVSAVVLVYAFAVCVWKFVLPKIEMDWEFWKPTIKAALPFFLAGVFSVIAFKINIVMLSMMKGDVIVGWYSAAYRLIVFLVFIPSAFSGSIYPILSKYYISSQESLKLAYQKSFKYMCVLSFPITIGTILLADSIILIIYKSGYVHSIIALQVLACVVPFTFLTHILAGTLNSINRQDLTMKILLLCMISNVTMNLILIPRYSYVGAAIATVITDLIQCVLCFHFLSKFVYKIQIHKFIAKPAITSAIMGLFILSFVKMNLFLLVCISTLIYFGVLILLKTFSKEDLNLFKQIVNIKREEIKE